MHRPQRNLDLCHHPQKLCRKICQKKNGVLDVTTKKVIKKLKTKIKTKTQKIKIRKVL